VKAKHQRLTLALVALGAVVGAAFLALSGLQDKASYFYTPSDLAKAHPSPDQAIRLGGMVADKSIQRDADRITVHFVVTDKGALTPVTFKGITPDLFKENSGVIAEGKLGPDGVFVADNLLAKHDERYMPPKTAGAMHETGKVS
jgi:cytochrome c-type biogenesis protein CcmE